MFLCLCVCVLMRHSRLVTQRNIHWVGVLLLHRQVHAKHTSVVFAERYSHRKMQEPDKVTRVRWRLRLLLLLVAA